MPAEANRPRLAPIPILVATNLEGRRARLGGALTADLLHTLSLTHAPRSHRGERKHAVATLHHCRRDLTRSLESMIGSGG